jgi:hypothetical protein
MKIPLATRLLLILFLGFICNSNETSAQSGGNFTIERAVIAPGGNVAGGAFAVQGVAGQPSAGNASGGQFSIAGGFITPQFVPTAASVSVSGRLLTSDGAGIRNAIVVLNDVNGNQRSARTGTFGTFRFDSIEVGQTYIIHVQSRRFQFSPQVLAVTETISGLTLTAWPE